jgi:hypothetical protein
MPRYISHLTHTHTMHIKSMKHNSTAMYDFPYTLAGFEPGPSVPPESDAMSTTPRRHGQ